MSKNIQKEELIGINTRITNSKNKNHVGIAGTIIDETKNTITIKTNKGNKMLMKDSLVLELQRGREKFLVDGKLLLSRPEDRIKKSR
jgi:ribonuclease P protein subunit POP4